MRKIILSLVLFGFGFPLAHANLLQQISLKEGKFLVDNERLRSNQWQGLGFGFRPLSRALDSLSVEVGVNYLSLATENANALRLDGSLVGKLSADLELVQAIRREQKPLSVHFGPGVMAGTALIPYLYVELKYQMGHTFFVSTGAGTLFQEKREKLSEFSQHTYLQVLSLTYSL